MTPKKLVALALADTFLARDASVAGLIESATWAFGHKWRWIPSLCKAIHKRTGENFYYFSRDELAGLILDHRSFNDAWKAGGQAPQIAHYCLSLPIATEQPRWLSALSLPALATAADLARWLNTPLADLDWFADQWRDNPATTTALQHYHHRWLEKKSGGLRLIEIPKSRLRAMQTQILRNLLDLIPPHQAAHGFRRAHSSVTHAALHAGKRVAIRIDLKNFFTSIPAARVQALFAKLGYSTNVAGALARICTYRTPSHVLGQAEIVKALPRQERMAYRTRHLPQGSPSSPALANLCAFRLDIRLDALAKSLDACYSRYADDLVFSGNAELEQAMDRFHVQVAAIAREEGFAVNTRKTRMMRAGTRQQVTGIVVNRHPNIARKDFDILKAILTNCIRHGPTSQNREQRPNFQQYLGGKVAYTQMVNPQRGNRLRQLFEKIVWADQ
ncbi:MAG: reverse transcriptase family protein [Burkholderiaceae bacterium]|nr:reverse transcriptase family protein [Burkholderiaceae bacterium]